MMAVAIRSLTSLVRRGASAFLLGGLRVYRNVISPLFPPVCGFTPTCSAYAMEAITVHGPLKGTGLAIWRLLRCHPITWLGGSGGFDPVPPQCHTHSH